MPSTTQRASEPLSVHVGGMSFGTRHLDGPVEVRDGVRADVDWATIDTVPPPRH